MAERDLAENPMSRTLTSQEAIAAKEAERATKNVLRNFYHSADERHSHWTKQLNSRKAYAACASAERFHVKSAV